MYGNNARSVRRSREGGDGVGGEGGLLTRLRSTVPSPAKLRFLQLINKESSAVSHLNKPLFLAAIVPLVKTNCAINVAFVRRGMTSQQPSGALRAAVPLRDARLCHLSASQTGKSVPAGIQVFIAGRVGGVPV